jgi:hypothetical protein
MEQSPETDEESDDATALSVFSGRIVLPAGGRQRGRFQLTCLKAGTSFASTFHAASGLPFAPVVAALALFLLGRYREHFGSICAP